jgi:5'-methylthioadenosine phosphorylase
MEKRAEIGVIGGSGFYSFLENVTEIKMDTPYGPPSDKLAIATVGDKQVAFVPRHGKDHWIPPHKINYRAQIWALKELGVERIIAPTASGSLQAEIKPGDFVICDQFIDRTSGRIDTFYDGPITTHISMAEPYCPVLRKLAAKVGKDQGITIHEEGTVVVIQGPRFSTKAESKWFSRNGWEVINMTQYPEVALARELGMCYVNIALITDYDAGLEGHPDIKPVNHQMVLGIFNENIEKLRGMLFEMIHRMPKQNDCETCIADFNAARIE